MQDLIRKRTVNFNELTLLTSNNKKIETYQRPSLAKIKTKTNTYIHTYTYIHTCIHTYIHTFIYISVLWKPHILNLVPKINALGR